MQAHGPRSLPHCIALCTVGLTVACGTANAPSVRTGASAQAATKPAPAPSAAALSPAPTRDISEAVLARGVVRGIDPVVNKLFAYVQPHLPGPLAARINPEQIKEGLLRELNLPGLRESVDGSRPVALVLCDPEQYRDRALGPVIVAVPFTDEGRFLSALEGKLGRADRLPWGEYRYPFNGRTLYVRLYQGHALLASQEALIQGARAVVEPLLSGQVQRDGDANITFDLRTLRKLHGTKIDAAMTLLTSQAASKQGASMNMLTRWLNYFKTTDRIDVIARLEGQQVKLTTTLTAAATGALDELIHAQKLIPPFRVDLLPADAALVISLFESPERSRAQVDENLAGYTQGPLADAFRKPDLEKLRALMIESTQLYKGAASGAFWATTDGGIAFAQLSETKNGPAAVELLAKAGALISAGLARMSLAKLGNGWLSKLKLKPRMPGAKLTVQGRIGKTFELGYSLPTPKAKDEREELAKVKRALIALLGKTPTIGLVPFEDMVIIAGGKDYQRHLAAIIKRAQDKQGSGLAKTIGSEPSYLLIYASLAALLEQGMRVAGALTTIPPEVAAMVQNCLPGPGKDAPAIIVGTTRDNTLTVDTRLSADGIGMATKVMVLAAMRGMAHP